MSTSPSKALLHRALSGIDEPLRTKLIDAYFGVRAAYANGNFDTVGQRAGFCCEYILRVLQNALTGTYTPLGQRLPTFHDECVRLQSLPKSAGPESLRIILPRALDFVYTLRNKRGIGHVGGDIDANQIDAATSRRVCDWCVAEMLRIYHSLSLEEAQGILDALSVRELPSVWRVGAKRRVLRRGFDYKSQVLLILHGELEGTALVEDLCAWVEHPRASDFRSRVLRPLHEQRLIEYDKETQTATISPAGIERVEKQVLAPPTA